MSLGSALGRLAVHLSVIVATFAATAARADEPSLVVSTFAGVTDPGHVQVTSSFSGDTYTYQVTNIDYNPSGGAVNVGAWYFGFGDAVGNNPVVTSVTTPAGWSSNDFVYSFGWYAGYASVSPEYPNLGLLPGQSAVFSFAAPGSTPAIRTGFVTSAFTALGVFPGTARLHGDVLFPAAVPVPEPATAGLAAAGLLALCALRARRSGVGFKGALRQAR